MHIKHSRTRLGGVHAAGGCDTCSNPSSSTPHTATPGTISSFPPLVSLSPSSSICSLLARCNTMILSTAPAALFLFFRFYFPTESCFISVFIFFSSPLTIFWFFTYLCFCCLPFCSVFLLFALLRKL